MLQGEIDTNYSIPLQLEESRLCSTFEGCSLQFFEDLTTCEPLQPIRTGQFAWSLLSFGNIRDLLQWQVNNILVLYSCYPMLSIFLKLCLWQNKGEIIWCILANLCISVSVSTWNTQWLRPVQSNAACVNRLLCCAYLPCWIFFFFFFFFF